MQMIIYWSEEPSTLSGMEKFNPNVLTEAKDDQKRKLDCRT